MCLKLKLPDKQLFVYCMGVFKESSGCNLEHIFSFIATKLDQE
jgi:hypothetical protein